MPCYQKISISNDLKKNPYFTDGGGYKIIFPDKPSPNRYAVNTLDNYQKYVTIFLSPQKGRVVDGKFISKNGLGGIGGL